MTKKEALEDIDKLCGEIEKWTTNRVEVHKSNDFVTFMNLMLQVENLMVSAHQELTFLRDYIEENIEEDEYQESKVDGNFSKV